MSQVTLLTFGPMIDSEIARQLLRHYRVPFTEERHLFGWSSILSLIRAGTPRNPVIMGQGLSLAGSRAVANYFDPLAPDDLKLLPIDPTLRAEMEAWQAFNGRLGPQVAVVAYYHLLPQTRSMIACFSDGVAPAEAARTAQWYGALRWLFTLLLQLNPTHAAQALDQVRHALDVVDRRVADGRAVLVGDRLTLSDINLACAIAPLILPEHYDAPVPALADMPPALQSIVAELRQRPSADFVSQIYDRMA